MKKNPTTVSELITFNRQEFYRWQSIRHESMILDDTERYSRCYEAAADGCDGSTHAENIDDMREYGDEVYAAIEREIEDSSETDSEAADRLEAMGADFAALRADFAALESWHENNGSLESLVD